MKAEEYADRDSTSLLRLLAKGEISGEEVLEACERRFNEANPELNAVIHADFDRARADLKTLRPRPFGGIPFLMKGLGASVKGFPAHFCCNFFFGNEAESDSNLVRRYREAGLNAFGLTNSPEFGLNLTTEPKATGITRNPIAPEHSAGGSSGGSAAAVAAGIVPVAHASDGGGSIRVPSSCCGLFGLKPTRGRNPMGPEVGEGWAGMTADHVIAKSVRDSALFLDASQGPDEGAPYHAPPPAESYSSCLEKLPGKKRIAFARKTFFGQDVHPECALAVDRCAEALKAEGHELVEAAPVYDPEALQHQIHLIIKANVRLLVDMRAKKLGRPPTENDLETLTHSLYFKRENFTAEQYAFAVAYLHKTSRFVGAFFSKHDALITPTLAEPPAKLGELSMVTADFETYWRRLFAYNPFTGIFNVTGQPAASVPVHRTPEGLPVGVQVVTGFANETLLFQLSSALEKAFPVPRKPAR